MKQFSRLSFLVVLLLFAFSFNARSFSGKIGTYSIEMEIEKMDWETGLIKGRYKYQGKTSYLQLKGELLKGVICLEESYEGEVTGIFYLNKGEKAISGKWIGNGKAYDVELYPTPAELKHLKTKTLEEYSEDTNPAVSGGYGVAHYFLNDWWFSEEEPVMEVGFNGGTLVLDQFHSDSLEFMAIVICGPTYHEAFAGGTASRINENTFGCLLEVYEGDSCYVQIELAERSAHVEAYGGFVCGFGARAYLDHTFIKVTDRYNFEEEVVGIDELLKN